MADPAPKAANGGGSSAASPASVGTMLLGAVTLLGALLAALGATNGGIGRVELNERTWLLVGVILVIASILLGSIYFAFSLPSASSDAPLPTGRSSTAKPKKSPAPWLAKVVPLLPVALFLGAALLVAGLVIVAYATVTHVSGRPSITATVSKDTNLNAVLVSGMVTVSDIPSSQHLEMRVNAVIPGTGANGKPMLFTRAIYAASLGPNSSGDISHPYEVVLPQGTFQVLVQAWTGKLGYCFSTEIPKGTPKDTRINNDSGCLRLRLPPNLVS